MEMLTKNWGPSKDVSALILRLAFGYVLLHAHGWEKLGIIFGGQEIKFMDPIGLGTTLSFYLAAFAEGLMAILLILGLITRVAAMILIGNFLVILYAHVAMFGEPLMTLELQLFYLFAFVLILILGPGKYSLDNMLFNKAK
jgi:putative oxidoreductase